jgi:long-chain acyl-CoA synthetase
MNELRNAVLQDFKIIRREVKLNALEEVKGIILTDIEWTPDTNLVTPTLKLKRPQIRDYYYKEIQATYKEVDEPIK